MENRIAFVLGAAGLVLGLGTVLGRADERPKPPLILAQAGSGSSRYPEPAGSGSSRDYPTPPVRTAAPREANFAQAADSPALRQAALDLVARDTRRKGGHFLIADPIARKMRSLRTVKVHDRVARVPAAEANPILRGLGGDELDPGSKEAFFVCVDFEDVKTSEALDLDIWMARQGEHLAVQHFAIHQVDGRPRFRYGASGIIPAGP